MPSRSWRRTTASVVGTLAVTFAVSATATPALAKPAKADPISAFPSDRLTIPDRGQLTGRRGQAQVAAFPGRNQVLDPWTATARSGRCRFATGRCCSS